MKLLLCSSGITNRIIARELGEMTGKDPSNCKIAFIPTAANAEPGNKDWVINQYLSLWRRGYSYIDIVDPSAPGIDWKPRLQEADILYLSGGNTFYLLDQVKKTGFDIWLKENLESKVYVGGSASSIVMAPTIEVAGIENIDENIPGITDLTGLGYVDFEIIPHVPSSLSSNSAEKYARSKNNKVYILDDESAVKVVDNTVEVVSEGLWKVL